MIVAPGNSEQGGVGTFVRQLYDLLHGEDVQIVSGSTEQPGRFRGKPCRNVPGFGRVPTLSSLIEIVRAAKSQKHTVMVCSGTSALLVAALCRVLIRRNLAVVSVFHGLVSRYEKPALVIRLVERLAAKLSDRNVFLNMFDRNQLKARGLIIPNAIDERLVSIDRAPDLVTPPEVVVVARHSKQKNVRIALELATSAPDIKISIYGGGPDFQRAIHHVREHGLRNVQLIEWAAPSEIYRQGRIFVLPTFAEGFPFSILEAASRRMPLVLSDLPELRSICGEHAQYFANDSPGTLLGILRSLLRAERYRHWAQCAGRLCDAYTHYQWSQDWKRVLVQCST